MKHPDVPDDLDAEKLAEVALTDAGLALAERFLVKHFGPQT